MRESNLSFPANCRACVVISSQLYDRRALDSPLLTLPLLTSLQHLAYLTSTSPRIREILTLDGGLERLVNILGKCLDLAAESDGSSSTANASKKRKPARFVPFKPFSAYSNGSSGKDYVDMQTLTHTYGFALQCIVNVGVRGSEQIRTRVVEGGVLPVVARILSGFLAERNKERERRLAALEPSRSVTLWRDHNGVVPSELSGLVSEPSSVLTQPAEDVSDFNDEGALAARNVLTTASSASSVPVMMTTAPTPLTSRPSLSGSLAALDSLLMSAPAQLPTLPPNASRHPPAHPHLPIHRTNTPDTVLSIDEVEGDQQSLQSGGEEQENEAESSGQEVDENDHMDTEEESSGSTHGGSRGSSRSRRTRRGTVKLSDLLSATHRQSVRSSEMPSSPVDTRSAGHSGPTVSMMSEQMDTDGDVIMSPHSSQQDHSLADPAATPLGRLAQLPQPQRSQHRQTNSLSEEDMTVVTETLPLNTRRRLSVSMVASTASNSSVNSANTSGVARAFHHKEEDVLHCLHLLAYLSKYPHVRAVFHDPENEAARPPLPPAPSAAGSSASHSLLNASVCARKKQRCGENGEACSSSCSADHAHDQDVMEDEDNEGMTSLPPADGRTRCSGSHTADDLASLKLTGAEACCEELADLARAKALACLPAKDRKPALEPTRPPRSTANNVFSLVEQYTFRPSSPSSQIDRTLRLPTDIQYWAGVIMRNACRKDELRGGIRQCANMGCGVWERFPREFAKCRRCRKAKYCSKGCQRRAWQSGHRYWCSARQDNPPQQPNVISTSVAAAANEVAVQIATANAQPGTNIEEVLVDL